MNSERESSRVDSRSEDAPDLNTAQENMSEQEDLSHSLNESSIEAIEQAVGPIVEVGGDAEELLPADIVLSSKPITTDIVDWNKEKGLSLLADGKELPFADATIAMIMANHMSDVDYFKPSVRNFIDNGYGGRDASIDGQTQVERVAKEDYQRFHDNPKEPIEYNLRINLMKEMTRVTRPGGLMLFGAISDNDIVVAQALGWEVVQKMYKHKNRPRTNYNCLFRKVS